MLTAIAAIIAILFGVRAGFLPPMPAPVKVSVLKHGEWQGQFALLMVTTLQRLLLNGRMPGAGQPLGAMQMMAIEGTRGVLFRALVAASRGRLWRSRVSGLHLGSGDALRKDRQSVGWGTGEAER